MRGPIKCHGGKFYTSSWIISHFPRDYEKYDYIEPYVGGASVFLNKNRSQGIEAINDLDLGVIQIYRALRDEPANFINRLKRVKYCEATFKRIMKKSPHKNHKDYMDHAISEFILRRMSRGGLKTAFAWSERERGGQPGEINAWETILQQLPLISERLNRTYIFNENAISVIKAFDDEKTLLYADPPYLPDTRSTTDAYEYEMDTDDHIILAESLNKFKGKVIISGYPSQLYKRLYKNWNTHKKKIANHASQQKKKEIKTEILWSNY